MPNAPDYAVTPWVRVRDAGGNDFDRHHTDPGLEDGTFTPVSGYPLSHEPRAHKYRTEKDGTPADQLQGEALDAALKAAGLPSTGKVDEKRARLVEHEIAQEVAPAADAPIGE